MDDTNRLIAEPRDRRFRLGISQHTQEQRT